MFLYFRATTAQLLVCSIVMFQYSICVNKFRNSSLRCFFLFVRTLLCWCCCLLLVTLLLLLLLVMLVGFFCATFTCQLAYIIALASWWITLHNWFYCVPRSSALLSLWPPDCGQDVATDRQRHDSQRWRRNSGDQFFCFCHPDQLAFFIVFIFYFL